MKVAIRKMKFSDIDLKVKWINNPKNNKFLHYDLPLKKNKTEKWFENNKNNKNRFDGIIECDDTPIGLIGLLSINDESAEYYITMGEEKYKHKGVAKKASMLLLEKAFLEYNLKKLYLYTETDNIAAQRLFDKLGFVLSGSEEGKTLNRGKPVNRYYYELSKKDYMKLKNDLFETPICFLENNGNKIFIKRDDIIPYSFGGNKARKGLLFFEEVIRGKYDYVVTYGSSSSNHCRVIANLAASNKIPCIIISPNETDKETANKKMMRLFNAKIINTDVKNVKKTIDNTLKSLKNEGFNPYFIQGGGHGNIGTKAYIDTYQEIHNYQIKNSIHFDYIFHASGTGTTQAGLICGKILNNDDTKIIGISIARKLPYGRDVVIKSVKNYMDFISYKIDNDRIEENTIFIDDYVDKGYGSVNEKVIFTVKEALINYGIPLDTTYTGKAFYGMRDFLSRNCIKNKNILFIHTGGTPLFFNDLEKL